MPYANKAGVIIRHACISGGPCALYAFIAPPSSYGDTSMPIVAAQLSGGGLIIRDLFIQAGYGLWFANSATACTGTVNWDAL